MPQLDGQAFSRARLQVAMQSSRCQTRLIQSSTWLKFKSLLQTIALNEQPWVQHRLEALFAQVLAMARSAVSRACLAGSLFLVDSPLLAEAMLGMMPLLFALLLAQFSSLPPTLSSASRPLSLRTSTFQAR
jgi:hypothetical protein